MSSSARMMTAAIWRNRRRSRKICPSRDRHDSSAQIERYRQRTGLRPAAQPGRAAAHLVLHRTGDFRARRGDRLYRLVVHRHRRQLGQAAGAGAFLARFLSALPCARLRRRHCDRRPDAARFSRGQYRRAHFGAHRRGVARPHAGRARHLQERQADIRDRVQPERHAVPQSRVWSSFRSKAPGRSFSSLPIRPPPSPACCRPAR